MRPGQNKRIRGRGGRKGPNPLTRSYESNGPDVKIRGTAQHIAEKYLQLARDAQSSGDTIMAESLLQHAEHYFRIIAAAQQQQQLATGYGRQAYEPEAELSEEDDDFVGVPDRFAPLSERLPQPSYPQQPQPPAGYAAQQPPTPPHFAPPQPPQPFEERPFGEGPRQEGPRHERPPRQDRGFGRGRGERGHERAYGAEGGERSGGYEQRREGRRYPRGGEAASAESPAADAGVSSLPSFITAPTPISSATRAAEPEAPATASEPERAETREREPVGYHLNTRRRRRRPAIDEAGAAPAEQAQPAGELPLGE